MLVLGPSSRLRFGDGPAYWGHRFGVEAAVDTNALERIWFDRWLKSDRDADAREAPLRLFVMGANEWRYENEWPLARTDWQRWYLHSAGRANSARGHGGLSVDMPGDEPEDKLIYDPPFLFNRSAG